MESREWHRTGFSILSLATAVHQPHAQSCERYNIHGPLALNILHIRMQIVASHIDAHNTKLLAIL
jgi:hypothetical protein